MISRTKADHNSKTLKGLGSLDASNQPTGPGCTVAMVIAAVIVARIQALHSSSVPW